MAFIGPGLAIRGLGASQAAESRLRTATTARRTRLARARVSCAATMGTSEKPVPEKSRFCQSCASPMSWVVPDGDTQERLACTADDCGQVLYVNPKVTVATVAVTADRKRVLLARRKIAPYKGSWNIPGGFLEVNETLQEGAMRECREEVNASIHILDLLAVYDIVAAPQVQLVYLAVLLNEKEVTPGEESEEATIFKWSDVPWDEISLTTHKWALLRALNTFNTSQPGDPIVPELRAKPVDFEE